MRTKIISIGNSKGIRIPKPLLKKCDLNNEVDLDVRGRTLVISPAKGVRAQRPRAVREGWAEAFAKMLSAGAVEAYSAGSNPLGKVNPKAVAAMKELNYDLAAHQSKSLEDVKQFGPFDAVVTMGCGDACPWMPAKKFIDWEIPDPKEMNEEDFRKVRNLVKDKVNGLLSSL